MTEPLILETQALLASLPVRRLLEAVEEVLEDFCCSESSDDYVPIEEALLEDLWAAFQPFAAAREPGELLPEPGPPPNLVCPVCDESRDHPQPFLAMDGRWMCGACWFETGQLVEMESRSATEELL